MRRAGRLTEKVAYAHTQNCDMMGTCALDWDGNGFADTCRAKGIDTDRYHLVALNIWGMPASQCHIIAVDTRAVGRRLRTYQHTPHSMAAPCRSWNSTSP